MSAPIRLWHDPPPAAIADSVPGFLDQLGGPCALLLSGRDRTRSRAIVTLLHGNEPSGLMALHRWLRDHRPLAVDLLLFFGAVDAARHEALFRHRLVPGERDLNRCFRPPFDQDRPGRIAGALLALLDQLGPECVFDIHNTSGRSGAFGVVTVEERRHEALVALFTRRLIVTDLRLGALMETTRADRPTVTIECGGAGQEHAVEVAWQGLQVVLYQDELWPQVHAPVSMDVYRHPVRLELSPECRLAYADAPVTDADLTVPTDIELLNFGVIGTHQALGWLGPHGRERLRLVDARGQCHLDRLFTPRQGRLYPARPLKLFMVTSNPAIARSDCLLYATQEADHAVEALE